MHSLRAMHLLNATIILYSLLVHFSRKKKTHLKKIPKTTNKDSQNLNLTDLYYIKCIKSNQNISWSFLEQEQEQEQEVLLVLASPVNHTESLTVCLLTKDPRDGELLSFTSFIFHTQNSDMHLKLKPSFEFSPSSSSPSNTSQFFHKILHQTPTTFVFVLLISYYGIHNRNSAILLHPFCLPSLPQC